ncbi:MAG: hypothetical protein DRJ44_02955 [Thermoprotei archaeon]|nr:MAG: hypothetical protein DRJ44_02955 [Thermoprotei archaeon]
MLEIYIKDLSGKCRRIGFLNFNKVVDDNILLSELVRTFSIKPSPLKAAKSLILHNMGKYALLDKRTIHSVLMPLAKTVYSIRRESVFNDKMYDLLEEILDGTLDLEKVKKKDSRLRASVLSLRPMHIEHSDIGLKSSSYPLTEKTYEVLCYNIDIIEDSSPEAIYRVRLFSDNIDVRLSYGPLGRISVMYDRKYFLKKTSTALFDEIMDHRLTTFYNIARRFCPDVLSELTKTEYKKLAYLSFFSSLRVTRIMPFLIDDKVQEFYQDAPSTKIYLDHEDYGRCISNIALSSRELNSFLTHIKIDTGSFISFLSPSLKTDYRTALFKVRVSIDMPPLAVDGIALDVRKYGKKPLSLIEIVDRDTLTADSAAFILVAAIFRSNILLCGEPGSGKTTLLNALDMLLPRTFRKVYVEDVVESVNQLENGRHQLRLKVGALEESDRQRSSKAVEIIKMLHRKPDYLILGELQSEDHVKAAFHAMNAGLRCIQTTHAHSLEQLVYRYIDVFSIPSRLLLSLDLIIFMKRDFYRKDRKEVVSILEKNDRRVTSNPLNIFRPIFSRQFNGLLKRVLPYEKSSLIEKISVENRIPKSRLISFIEEVKSMIAQQQILNIEHCLNNLFQ